jgi:hypothetical protein
MRILRETSVMWGNIARNYYFENGRRIPAAYATWILKNHFWEAMDSARQINGRWIKEWNIGPRDTDQ